MIGSYIVYELIDPRTNRPRYIGLTRWKKTGWRATLARRVSQHLACRVISNQAKHEWLAELTSLGLRPSIRALEVVPPDEAYGAETRWMRERIQSGECLLNSERTFCVRKRSTPTRQRPIETEPVFQMKVFTVTAWGLSAVEVIPIPPMKPAR